MHKKLQKEDIDIMMQRKKTIYDFQSQSSNAMDNIKGVKNIINSVNVKLKYHLGLDKNLLREVVGAFGRHYFV